MPKDQNEEIVPLNGPVSSSTAETKAPKLTTKIIANEKPIFDVKKGNLSDKITKEMSDAEVLDAILSNDQDTYIPWEEVSLPSLGLYYGWQSGVINVRAWGANVDKILATQRLVRSGQALSKMLEICCRFPTDFNAEDLLVGDQIFLLYYLRGITYGNEYEFVVTAPSGNKQMCSFDLNELATTIKYADVSKGLEPFTIDLPYLSDQIGRSVYIKVRYLRVRDNTAIARNQNTLNKAVGNARKARVANDDMMPNMNFNDDVVIDDTLIKNLSRIVVEALGNQDRHVIDKFINNLHSSDLATIREWLKDNTPGINPVITVQDEITGDDFQVALPITPSFFRPQGRQPMRT